MNIHTDGDSPSPLLSSSPHPTAWRNGGRPEEQDMLAEVHLFSQAQTQGAWHLLLPLSLVVAGIMADKTQMTTRDRALKGREEKMVVAGK